MYTTQAGRVGRRFIGQDRMHMFHTTYQRGNKIFISSYKSLAFSNKLSAV